MLLNEEEKKKREEEAKSIINNSSIANAINSVNYANLNNSKIEIQNNEEQNFINKIKEANSIINSINPRTNIQAPGINEFDKVKSQENAQNLINLIDDNNKYNMIENNIEGSQDGNNTLSEQNYNKDIQKLEKLSQPTVQVNKNNNTMSKNFSLANQAETENAQKLTSIGISAMQEANRKNKNIDRGGIDKFNEIADTILNNIYGGAKQTVSGLVNVVTTIAGFGIKGLEGASKIVGIDSVSDKLNGLYNSIIDKGNDINEIANYENAINSQVENDLTRTTGNVANVISNMVSSQLIGYATGISGTTIQGMSVGGNSSQEVLNKNKDNIGQATLTGIAKGYTSYLTEKMFDANILTKGMNKTSIEQGINKLISNRIQSEFGKELANKTVGIIGENIEELVEDNAGYLIDKLINNEELPGFQQWWNNTTETAKITTLSTFIMGLIGLGGQSFKDIEKDMETQYWIDEAQKIIEKENLGIHFNPNEVKDLNTIQDYYITDFNPDGEISNITATKGIVIENINSDLNVLPVIVRDSNTNAFNIIDGNTGVMIDSTYYQTRLEAEQSYNEKVKKLSDLQIKDINKKINEANYMITDKIMNMISQAQIELQRNSNIDNKINNENNITQQQKYNSSNSKQNENSSTFYSGETNYAVQDIDKLKKAFDKKKEYTKSELANVWNNEISENEYDLKYDNEGNIQSYIAIEEEGENLVINQYDSDDNIAKSEIISSNNGKYTSEVIKNTIEKVSSIYDENRPIKGQVDIEGNEIRNMKNEKNQNYSNATDLIRNETKKAEQNFNTNINIEKIDKLSNINFNKIKENDYIKLSKEIFKENFNKRIFHNDNTNIDVKVILADIKESAYKAYNSKYQQKFLKEHIEALSRIDEIIKSGLEVSTNNETKNREQYKNWRYFSSQAIIENKPFLVQFDVTEKDDGYHFRLQRLAELNLKNNKRVITLALTNKQVGANSRQ